MGVFDLLRALLLLLCVLLCLFGGWCRLFFLSGGGVLKDCP